MNRRGFLGAFTAAVAGTAATAIPLPTEAAPPAPARVLLGRARHPAHLEWKLPHDFTGDDVQKCIDATVALDKRFVVVSAEFGSAEDRARYLQLMAPLSSAGDLVPLYINERLGPRGLRFEVETHGTKRETVADVMARHQRRA